MVSLKPREAPTIPDIRAILSEKIAGDWCGTAVAGNLSPMIHDLYDPAIAERAVARILSLSPGTAPLWGRMSATQMLAHCNVAYEMTFEPGRHRRPNAAVRLLLRLLVKPQAVGTEPYGHGARTAPQFIIRDDRNFERERDRLVAYVWQTVERGPAWFEGRTSDSFGPLTAVQWNNLLSKHLDHHLSQFGA